MIHVRLTVTKMSVEFANAVRYLLAITWIFPAFKNYKTNFFIYFLLLAVADPVSHIYRQVFNQPIPQILYLVIIPVLQLTSLIRWKNQRNVYSFLAIVLTCSVTTSIIFQNIYYDLSLGFLFQLIIFFQILKLFAINIYTTGSFNFFLIILIFYQLTNATKLLVLLLKTESYLYHFVITGAVQILIGIFFSFFNVNSKSIQFKLKNYETENVGD